jgi:hypothetical protein
MWEAIHHRRTLYGRVCADPRSFFDAIDQVFHENHRSSD